MRWGTISASHTPGFPFDTRESIAHSPGPFADAPKKRILLFLRAWLFAEGEHMDHELLSSIGTFASAISGSDILKEVAREIVGLVHKNVCSFSLTCVS